MNTPDVTYQCCGSVGPLVPLSTHDRTCPTASIIRDHDEAMNLTVELRAGLDRIYRYLDGWAAFPTVPNLAEPARQLAVLLARLKDVGVG